MITHAIILAAGRGTRLAPHTDVVPKCLLEVGGRSLLAHQVHRLAAVGVRRVTLVGGYRLDALRRAAAALPIPADIVENADHADTNTAASLLLGIRGAGGFYLLNGDVLFPTDLLRAIAVDVPAALAVEPKGCGEEEVKVIVDDAHRIHHISKQLDPARCLGEFTGVARFQASVVAPLERALEETVAVARRTAYFEAALQRIVGEVPLTAVPVRLPVIEIDFPEDLARARGEVVRRIERLEADGRGALGG